MGYTQIGQFCGPEQTARQLRELHRRDQLLAEENGTQTEDFCENCSTSEKIDLHQTQSSLYSKKKKKIKEQINKNVGYGKM